MDIYLRAAIAEAVQSLINFLFGGHAAATCPRLFCLRFFVGTSPRRFSLIPNFFSVLFCYVFAPRDTLEIAEVTRLAACGGFDSITLL